MTTPQDDLARIARAVIDANRYMTVATADSAGQPWPSPVWYAHAGYRDFFWVSSPGARHSRNLAGRPQAAIVVFDSHAAPGTAQAVYLTATAAEVTPDEVPEAIAVYSARSHALGAKRWTPAEVCGPAPQRLYRASVSGFSVIDGSDERKPAAL